MRRLVLLLVVLIFALPSQSSQAQTPIPTVGPLQPYRNDQLGVAFQIPVDWKVRESPERRTVTAASDADFKLIDAGAEPGGLVFSVSVSTFRQAGVERVDEFGERLRKIENQPNAGYRQLTIGGAEGVQIEIIDSRQNVGGRSAYVNVGQRRVAIVRGVTTIRAWRGIALNQYDVIAGSLSFFPPTTGLVSDRIGTMLWQATSKEFTTFADLGASADGTTVYATDPKRGLWALSATGIVQGVQAFDGIGSYGTLGMFRDGTRYIADPTNHIIWLIQAGSSKATKLLGGSVGVNRGQFGAGSPRVFAFGFQNTINVLDNIESGTRIQIFSRGGEALTAWNITAVEDGAISTDGLGYVYVIGKNTTGIIKIGADGKVVNPALGRFTLAGIIPTAIAVDRFGYIYVATTDAGIIRLDENGKLSGVIGEPYDEAAAPKLGQLGKPTALALGQNDNILYIGDSGKFPQIVAVALSGNASVNVQAATVNMGAIQYGQTLNGEITNDGFLRAYSFTGASGEVVTITARSIDGSLDMYVDLLGVDGSRIAANDDAKLPGAPATDAQIKSYRLPSNGTYTIRVTRFGRETSKATGTYSLLLEK